MTSQESTTSRASTIALVVVIVGTNLLLRVSTEYGRLPRLGLSLLAALIVAIVVETVVRRRQ